jgi:hypothetical protein
MRKGLLFVLVVVALSSCLKLESYPDRPDVTYIDHAIVPYATNLSDSLGYVRFEFTDGDGDLGLNQGDTFGDFAPDQQYYYNLFIRYFQKQNGSFEEIIPPGSPNVRFKNLTPSGADKTLQGEMAVGVYNSGVQANDTIRFEMYIVDRALNHSDTLVTPEIVIPN